MHSCVMSALSLAVDNQRYHLPALFLNGKHLNPSGLAVSALRNTHLSSTPVFHYNYGTNTVDDLSVKLKSRRSFGAK